MGPSTTLTPKGAATRARIVEAAADLVLARGVGGASLDDIRAATSTSKSQLFHYFPGGKNELVGAIATFQAERVFEAQRPWIDTLDTWETWDGWRRAVVAHYRAQTHLACPIGTMVSELASHDETLAAIACAPMKRWHDYLAEGVKRMKRGGHIAPVASPRDVATSIFAALQGGLLLMKSAHSVEPLEAGLTCGIGYLRSMATETRKAPSKPRA